MRGTPQPGIAQCLHHFAALGATNLQHRAQLFRKQRRDHAIMQPPFDDLRKALDAIDVVHQFVVTQRIEIQRNADMRTKTHLAHRGEQAAVGTIVVRKNFSGTVE